MDVNLEYTWTRDDLKNKLYKKRTVPNVIFLGLGILFYLYVTWYAFMDKACDIKILLLGFLIYFACLMAMLLLSTKMYVFLNLRRNDKKTAKAYGTYFIKVDDNGISSKINEEQISYMWKDISKFKKNKNSFFLATNKDHLGLYFDKSCIKEEQYIKLLQYVEERLSGF